ncbi:MAG TPA: NlpC/P60 family protein [Burkholderiaceae bacterium]|nr:NlpC/P60 family protein [Burkholderiaceae bacterium]
MTPLQFADACLALPPVRWVRWAANWERREADCWGLVTLYWRLVLGVDLGPVPRSNLEAGYWAALEHWPECEPEPGAAVFLAWQGGRPMHCGVLLPGGMLLHAEGDEKHGGSVRLTRLAAMRRVYSDLRFHRYAGPTC